MADGFIKNLDLLEEDYRIDDLLDFSKTTANFEKTLGRISRNAVIGLVGPFGSGKSTMLYQLSKRRESEKWIFFDAWKYPDRKDLWEGFVLDFAATIAPDIHVTTKKKIDGHYNDDTKTLINTIGSIPGFSVIKNLTHFVNTSPAKRVFEIQEILNELVVKIQKDICIVVEDIDRSGDQGVYFLETLRNFIKTNRFAHKIIVVVPISDKMFEAAATKDAYDKCLDYFFKFNPGDINFQNFIKTVFDDELLKNPHFADEMNFLFKNGVMDNGGNLRKLKTMLRIFNAEYQKLLEDGATPDVRVFILFSISALINKGIAMGTQGGPTRINVDSFAYNFLIWIAQENKIANARDLSNFVLAKVPIILADQARPGHGPGGRDYKVPVYVDLDFGTKQPAYFLLD